MEENASKSNAVGKPVKATAGVEIHSEPDGSVAKDEISVASIASLIDTAGIDSTEPQCFNPSLPTEINPELIEQIKGDAIGDTLYSERYVLSVLLKLSNIGTDFTDQMEKDLCILWDMTIEKDVVKLLLKHDVLELFALIVQTSENVRLTEIVVGIIGNMCCFGEARDILCCSNDIMATLLNLIDNDDAPTLIQLMRFFKTTLIFENSGDEILWFQHFRTIDNFIEKFSFILCNSTSTTLLTNALEALSAIFNKFSILEAASSLQNMPKKPNVFQETFVKQCLVNGLIEAFKQVLSSILVMGEEGEVADTFPTDKIQKFMNYFLEINVLLSQYETLSKEIYQPFQTELFDCISKILNPLCQPINLFPITPNTQDVIENVNEIFQSIGDPFDEKCFVKFTVIWSNIKKFQLESFSRNPAQSSSSTIQSGVDKIPRTSTSEWDCMNDDISTEDICMTILEYITRVNKNSNQADLNVALKIIGRKITEDLLNEIVVGDSEPDIEKCCCKLRGGLKTIWNI